MSHRAAFYESYPLYFEIKTYRPHCYSLEMLRWTPSTSRGGQIRHCLHASTHHQYPNPWGAACFPPSSPGFTLYCLVCEQY